MKNRKKHANSAYQNTRHHVPPKHPDKTLKPQILIKQRRHHEAYHLLFGSAPSINSCIAILLRDWWPNEDLPI